MRKKRVIILILILSFYTAAGAQDDIRPSFGMSVGVKYLSRFVAYGIDLAGDSPAWGASMSIGHRSGLYADAYYTRPTSSVEDAQQVALDIGYETEIIPRLDFYAELGHYIYSSDTVNIFSQYSNSLSANLSIDLEIFELGLSYDRFLGNNGASYFSVDLSAFQETGPFYLLPMVQFVFMSQTVDERFLHKGKGKKSSGTEVITSETVTGLANTMLTAVVVYPALEQLTLSIIPSLIFYHKSELSVESSRFIWSASLRYSFDL